MSKHRETTPNEPATEPVPAEPSGAWKILAVLAAFVAARVAQTALQALWRTATGRKPPTNPDRLDVDSGEAAVWAGISAFIVALARLFATRRAKAYYVRSMEGRRQRAAESSERVDATA